MKLYKFESSLKNTAITISEHSTTDIKIFTNKPSKKRSTYDRLNLVCENGTFFITSIFINIYTKHK